MATSNIGQQQTSPYDDYTDQERRLEAEMEASSMSLVDHLEELRWRIFKCLIALAIGGVIAFIFRDQIMNFLQGPLPSRANALRSAHGKLVVVGLTEGFTITLLVSLAAGTVLALPVLLYQTWAFIAPGLYDHEKKYAIPFIFIGLALFLAGSIVCYAILRFPIEWLISFSGSNFTELVTADNYFSFVAIFLLIFGIVFEMPLVLTFLAKVGLISEQTLRKKRSVAHVGMWLAACFLTPGADFYSPLILGVAMSILYELTIIIIHFTVKDAVVTA
ncbi:twin-arginine translocase subunit TatC [Tengunoibacter tsumagoiensis]|uniref:Sec-independent protein translocase protein TatC n=1 Tax=Tengunoibacter tsumagoiensis TaxID=2014871 RepID=A0A402A4J4_9CHLR|nr:twin-arginine translocase subunit TatC [Tengunoibacter tsumagoiensis]GCE13989.1 Sec-independent protein translocase protein TatC [Tengunoibacter tsumagoiensis]